MTIQTPPNRLRVLVALWAILSLIACAPEPAETRSVTFATADPVQVQVELAVTPSELRTGLMHRDHLGPGHGMLFVFPDEAMRYFWMKNTLIPLDIIFLSADRRVVSIAANAQPCRARPCATYPSRVPARYVVEVDAGFAALHGIEVGTSAEIELAGS